MPGRCSSARSARAHGWSLAEIQWAFTIFIATETWITPFAGYAVDHMGPRRGPRLMILLGGIGVGVGWVMNAYADTLMLLYAGAAVSGIGAGGIYATCVGNAVKWFPDRRGLAVGLTAAGFGAGAALTVIPIRMLIAARGYGDAFLWFGVGQGVILIIVAGILRGPDQVLTASAEVAQRLNQSKRSFTSLEMLGSPVFWLMYVMFVLNAATGLMATAQLAPIAKDFGISNNPILFGATVLSVALVVDNILNGLARPFFGWVSDHLGRELTMGIAFFLGACSYALLTVAGHGEWTFVHLRRADLLHLGRDFQPVPVALHRHVRSEIRRLERELPVHREGHSRVAGAVRERAANGDRRVGDSVRRRRHLQHRGGVAGGGCVAAVTPPGGRAQYEGSAGHNSLTSAKVPLSDGRLMGSVKAGRASLARWRQ